MHRKPRIVSILLVASVAMNLVLYFLLIPQKESERTRNTGRGSIGGADKPAASEREEGSHREQAHAQRKKQTMTKPRVELPWQLARPYFGIVPFDNNGTVTQEFIDALGLSPTEAAQISRICREARSQEVARIVAAAQPVERPDGKMAVRIPPTPNEAAGKTLSEIERLQLSQFPIIQTVIQDNVRYEEQFYERNISARTNQDGSIVLTEEFTNDGAITGRSEIRYENKKVMPLEYATLYDKYLNK